MNKKVTILDWPSSSIVNSNFSFAINVYGPQVIGVDYQDGEPARYVDASSCPSYPCTVNVTHSLSVTGTFTVKFTDYHGSNQYWNGSIWITYVNNYETRTITVYNVSAALTMDDPSAVYSALVQGFDLSRCASNCTNRGLCKLGLNNTYYCECFADYIGPTCLVDARPCTQFPCLNNGTCLQASNNNGSYNFTCDCKKNYNGDRCQYFDFEGLCANLSCVNGFCKFDKSTSEVKFLTFLFKF